MGNATSGELDEDVDFQALDKGDDVAATAENKLDFSCLFNLEALHKALLGIKEFPGNAIARSQEALIKWLNGLVERGETTVNLVQFVDFITNKEVSKEEAIEFFTGVDLDGVGVVDVTYFLMVLKKTPIDPVQALVPCNDLPGASDIWVDDKTVFADAGKKLIQFLHRHRVDADKVTVASLEQVLSWFTQREKLVEGRYYALLEQDKEGDLGGVSEADESGMERTVIAKCYSKMAVSSNQKTMTNLTNGRSDDHWQSNGSPRSHWIRFYMLPGVMLKELAVAVDSNDDSYMPKTIVVQVGNSESSLRDFKTHTVPRQLVGKLHLVRGLGTEYRIIQIAIRGCHSDGCDARIRGVFIKGYKYAREVEPTVLDTMATWYLGIIASTARAAMPVAPTLRTTILTQSKTALRSLSPLSISPSSPTKPEFLSNFVVVEMDHFLTSLCLPAETFVSVDADSMQVLLSFSLAHGSVNSILDCLQILLDNLTLELSVAPLLRKLEDIKQRKLMAHAEKLKLSVVSCDGGQKDESSGPDIMLSNDVTSSTGGYLSEEGKRVVNIVLEDAEKRLLTVSRLALKTQGAKAGLLFVFDAEEASAEGFLDRFSCYDAWTAENYNTMKAERKEKAEAADEFAPVAFFEPDELTHDADQEPDVVKSGKYVLLKLFGERKEEVEAGRVGVLYLMLHGRTATPAEKESLAFLELLDGHAPLPVLEGVVNGSLVLNRVLGFLADMLRDLAAVQARRKAASLDPTLHSEPHISIEDLSLSKIWSLYVPLTLQQDKQLQYASVLCLHVLRSALPFIKPLRPSSSSSSSSSTDPLAVPSAILSHLCGLLDSTAEPDHVVQRLAQEIVVEGVVLFFPDAKARKDYLLKMIDSVLDDSQPRSWWLKFEALCSYFSKTDSNSLLGLPSSEKEIAEVDSGTILNSLSVMITVATREAMACITSESRLPDDLVKLLCALQSALFFWCHRHITSKDEEVQKTAKTVLHDYVLLVVMRCSEVLRKLLTLDDLQESTLKALSKTILARTLPEMLVFLTTVADLEVDRISLLNNLGPLVGLLKDITDKVPSVFLKIDCEQLSSSTEVESVVRVWTRESKHNYENNSNINEEFVCPSASKFVLEFDSRCCTERRYDYLQFTDSTGAKKQFDETVGCDRWSRTAEFPGPRLQFYFHSDGSNNDWGYKFTLKAIGKTIPPLHWIFDLQLSLSKLLGVLCSVSLGSKVRPPLLEKKSDEQKEEEVVVHSDLWKTVFRGGYMVGRLTRSLSGAYYAASPSDSSISSLLQDLANGPTGFSQPLLDTCRAASKGPFYGGQLVDKAVNSVMAALMWHTQDIREELAPFASSSTVLKTTPTATPGILSAFKAAEAMRRELVEARQKLAEAKEKEEDEEKKAKMDEDAPIDACIEKALFLLKFSGLSRVQKDDDQPPSSPIIRPSWVQKSKKWQKVSSAISTVSKIKQQLHGGTEREKLSEKYPSFELVLSFVRNESLSVDRVHALLQERSRMASQVAEVYMFSAECCRSLGVEGVFELPGLTFLQQLLVKQRHFPRHYAAKLDGCGLDLENQVRKSFRLFTQRLMDCITSFSKPPSQIHYLARHLVSVCFVHLVDCEWQDYDITLLSELQLPEFLLQSAIKSSSVEERVPIDKFEKEEEMLKRYELHMQFVLKLKELAAEGASYREFLELPEAVADKKESELFLCAIAPSFPSVVRVNCDGCESTINGSWYRNTELQEDCDLCSTCFRDGTGERPDEHSKDHMYLMLGRFMCNNCKESILTHRFHSNTREDFDLCLGCLRKEEASGHRDDWTVFFLTEQPSTENSNRFLSHHPEHAKGMHYKDGILTKMGDANELMVYHQHHCWILFTSLTLTLAKTLNYSKTTSEGEYVGQACKILHVCLKLLSMGLRAVNLSQWDEAAKKKEAKDRQKAEKEAKKAAEAKRAMEAGGEPTQEEEAPAETQEKEGEHETTDGPPKEEAVEQEEREVVQEQAAATEEGETEKPQKETAETETVSESVSQTEVSSVEPATDSAAEPATEPATAAEPATEPAAELAIDPVREAGGGAEGETQEALTSAVEPVEETDTDTLAQPVLLSPAPQLDTLQLVLDTVLLHSDSEEEEVKEKETAAKKESHDEDTEEEEEEEEDSLIEAISRLPMEGDDRIGNMEKSFTTLKIDRILGLLVSILPQELSLSQWIQHKADTEVFLAEKLLPTLLQLSSCRALNESYRFMSLLTATQYMARVSPEVAERAIHHAHGQTPEDGEKTHGVKTVKHLYYIGANYLKKSNFTGAAMAAECLLLLSKALPWKSAINLTMNQTLQSKPQEMDLSSIFGLLVIAGFPKMAREGSILCKPTDDGMQRGVVHMKGAGSAGVINLKTRDKEMWSLSEYEVEDNLKGCITSSRIGVLLDLLKASLQLTKQDSDRLVEDTWVLALGLKALNVILQGSDLESAVRSLLDSGLVSSVVQLASKPTRFSRKWILADLEVLGIYSYQPLAGKKPEAVEVVGVQEDDTSGKEGDKEATDEGEDEEVEDKEGAGGGGEEAEAEHLSPEDSILRGIDPENQEMLKMMKEAFQCDLTLLRAMFDAAGGEMSEFMSLSEQYYDMDEGALKPPDEIIEAAKKWEPGAAALKEAVQDIQDSLEDMGVTKLSPVLVDLKSLSATAEDPASMKKSKASMKEETKDDTTDDKTEHGREESFKLLQGELEKLKNKKMERAQVLKSHQAIVVLQARQVLASLLARWPAGASKLSSTFLGCKDITEYFSLLDILLREQKPDTCKKILSTAVCCGEPTEVVSLALTAAQCMREVSVGREVKELRLPCKDEKSLTEKGKVLIPNASSIMVTFFDVKGTVEFGSNEDLSEHCKAFSADKTDPKKDQKHIVPGNVLFYTITLEPDEEDKQTSWTITMTGTQMGRFDTGYSILRILMCEKDQFAKCLPLAQLWSCLIAVACQCVGKERLKIVHLLLEMLDLQKSSLTGAEKVELSALKPLWQLYTTMMSEHDSRSKNSHTLSPEILRALTELFLTVENVAEEWGLSQDLLIGTLTQEALHTWLEKGISNVAFLGIGLGIDNLASCAFLEAKKNYVPKEDKKEETDGDAAPSSSSSSSDSDDTDSDEDEEEEYSSE